MTTLTPASDPHSRAALASVPLGDSLRVPAQGFGGMALTDVYGGTDEASALDVLHTALDAGITLFDTANIYGQGENEELFGRFLAGRRDQVVLATKFGFAPEVRANGNIARGDAPYVRECAEASLRRLNTDHIDLYYYHRVDPTVPIEETVGALAELVQAGLVREIGLSEVTATELERAVAVHPIAAVQSEWSVWSRDVEAAVVPAAARLGATFVPYSPLGRGFLAGAVSIGDGDLRTRFPRFSADALDANALIAARVRAIAQDVGATPAQVALAWLAAAGQRLGAHVVPIPGTRRSARVLENLGALGLTLPPAAIAELDELAALVTAPRTADPLSVSLGRE